MTTHPISSNHTNPTISHVEQVKELRESVAQLQTENDQLVRQIEDLQIELRATSDEYKRVYDETQRAKAELERANNVKSTFLASMSHELRTPLNAIINFTRFVAKGSVGEVNDEQRNMLNDVITSAKHLLNLINDVLDMSKIESGSLQLFIIDGLNVTATIEYAIATSRILLVDKPVTLDVSVAPDLPAMRGDEQRITQILLNILSNACKFTEAGSITLTATHTDDTVLITVVDTGPGIAVEEQATVFEPFKQTREGLRQGSGTGLGMPISKNLAEIHGGKLWLESELGKGTTFYLSLPIMSSHLTPTLPEKPPTVSGI